MGFLVFLTLSGITCKPCVGHDLSMKAQWSKLTGTYKFSYFNGELHCGNWGGFNETDYPPPSLSLLWIFRCGNVPHFICEPQTDSSILCGS